MFRHIVLFKVHSGVDAAKIAAATKLLQKLSSEPGIEEWLVTQSIDTRKGIILIEEGLFADEAAYQAFKDSAAHQQAAAFMREISNWLIGDYNQNTSLAPV